MGHPHSSNGCRNIPHYLLCSSAQHSTPSNHSISHHSNVPLGNMLRRTAQGHQGNT
jgi:hypothetical protein